MAKEEMNRSDGERRKVKKVKRNGRRKAGGRKDDKMNRKRPGGDGVELGKLATEPPCKEPKVGVSKIGGKKFCVADNKIFLCHLAKFGNERETKI